MGMIICYLGMLEFSHALINQIYYWQEMLQIAVLTCEPTQNMCRYITFSYLYSLNHLIIQTYGPKGGYHGMPLLPGLIPFDVVIFLSFPPFLSASGGNTAHILISTYRYISPSVCPVLQR